MYVCIYVYKLEQNKLQLTDTKRKIVIWGARKRFLD